MHTTQFLECKWTSLAPLVIVQLLGVGGNDRERKKKIMKRKKKKRRKREKIVEGITKKKNL
jgi:hypothetical protein